MSDHNKMFELAGRAEAAEARCKRLEDALEETVRVLKFAFEDGALPEETVLSLCIDPYGMLNDARTALSDTAQFECCCENPPPAEGVAESSVYHCSEECPVHGDGIPDAARTALSDTAQQETGDG